MIVTLNSLNLRLIIYKMGILLVYILRDLSCQPTMHLSPACTLYTVRLWAPSSLELDIA